MLPRITFYLSLAALFAAYLITGFSISIGSAVFETFFKSNYDGRSLPQLTQAFLPYGLSNLPIILSICFALLFIALLIFIDRSQNKKIYLPFWITLAWIPCILHISTAWMAYTAAFVSLNRLFKFPQ